MAARVNSLHTELPNAVQGGAPAGVYCLRLKAIADELQELGDPIDDRQLVNVLLVGLSPNNSTSRPPSSPRCGSSHPSPKSDQCSNWRITPSHARTHDPRSSPLRHVHHHLRRPHLSPCRHQQLTLLRTGVRAPTTKEKNPIYTPLRSMPSTSSPSPAPPPTMAPPPPMAPPPSMAPTAPHAWNPPHDPWTGMVQAWSMPWAPPSPFGAPPAYSGSWSPGMQPHTGAPGLLGSRPAANAYHAALTYTYGASPAGGSSYSTYPMHAPTLMAPPAPPQHPSTTPNWDQAAFL